MIIVVDFRNKYMYTISSYCSTIRENMVPREAFMMAAKILMKVHILLKDDATLCSRLLQ